MISHALISGAPEAVVRRWAEHVDEQIPKLYTHIADSDSKAYMSKLFNGVRDAGPGKSSESGKDESDRPEGSQKDVTDKRIT